MSLCDTCSHPDDCKDKNGRCTNPTNIIANFFMEMIKKC